MGADLEVMVEDLGLAVADLVLVGADLGVVGPALWVMGEDLFLEREDLGVKGADLVEGDFVGADLLFSANFFLAFVASAGSRPGTCRVPSPWW